ncbi:DUF5686 family protein [Crocinitomix catalasitica]|uniref:DUF5686 family protein n=1 Tax=Crocinitomix catalasitica TaxID=184607 RepID=UPI00146FAB68|nr:DUF5686 family protein [Crocinitomix catalasitica]
MHFKLIAIALLCSLNLSAQIKISGTVTDTITNQPIPFAKLFFEISESAVRADINGVYLIESKEKFDTLICGAIGYTSIKIPLKRGKYVDSTIYLRESITSLTEIIISPGENPAFAILKEVHKNKVKNNPDNLSALQCNIYNKMQFDINNMTEEFKKRAVFKKFDFIMDYMDTVNNKNYLPVLLTEGISSYYFNGQPKQEKEIINASRVTGVDNLQLGQFTGQMYQDVNVYEDYVELFNKEFMSPIAKEGRLFYKYILLENDTIENVPCFNIQFRPKRKGDAMFNGKIWITQKGFALKKIIAEIPDDVNLNYVSGFYVEQEYKAVNDSLFLLASEKMEANFDLFNDSKDVKLMGVTIHKNVTRKDFILNQPKPFDFYLSDVVLSDSAESRDNSYWDAQRFTSLSKEEAGVIEMVDSLKGNASYKFMENLVYLAYTGFWKVGPIEIGSLYDAYNRNVVEGTRFMLSLRTSNKFSKKVEISGFAAYGLKDEVIKYGGSLRWKISDNPREMLRFGYRKKIEQLGLTSTVGDVGNSITSLLSVGPVDKLTMVHQATVGFEKDYRVDMRTFHTVEWKNYIPLGSSDYSRLNPESGDTIQISDITSFQIRNQIMYTREEKFLAGQFDRISMGSKYPIISLTHTWGIKDFLASEYGFHRLDFIWNHRPRLGLLGRINYTVYAGKIFGSVPYPFLQIHPGNETYYLQATSFNLMNYYEFISDEWVGVDFEHHLQGFIMDRIPLVRKLKLRLVYNARMVIGRYDDRHNAEMLLPAFSNKFTSPYYEVSLGLENILKFIRVDAVWRLSYRDNLDLYGQPVTNFGIKFKFSSDF